MKTKTSAPNETDFATVIGEKPLKLRFSAEITVCFAPQSKKKYPRKWVLNNEMFPIQKCSVCLFFGCLFYNLP